MKNNYHFLLFVTLFFAACKQKSGDQQALDGAGSDLQIKNAIKNADAAPNYLPYNEAAWAGLWMDKETYEKCVSGEGNFYDHLYNALIKIENGKLDRVDAEDAWASINTKEKANDFGYFVDTKDLSTYTNAKVFAQLKVAQDTTLEITSQRTTSVQLQTYMRYRPCETALIGNYKTANGEAVEFLDGGKLKWGKYKHYQIFVGEYGDAESCDLLLLCDKKSDECLPAANAQLFVMKRSKNSIELYDIAGANAEDCLNDIQYADSYPVYNGSLDLSKTKLKYTLSK